MKNKKGVAALIAGIIILLVLGLIYGWSIFRGPLNAVFTDWTAADLSMNFTISIIFFCIGGFLSSRINTKHKPSFTIRLGAILLLIGFFGASNLNPEKPGSSLVMLYIFYGILCGTGVGLGYNSLLGSVSKWFPNKTGSVSGLLLMGFGTGSMLLGSLASHFITEYDVFVTFRILAVIAVVVVVACSFFISVPDASFMAAAAAASPKKNTEAAERDYAPGEIIRRPSFWLFQIWNVAISAGGLLVINSSAVIVKSFGAMATIGLLVSVFNGIGRPLIGVFFDNIGRRKTMALTTIILIAAALFMAASWQTKEFFLLLPGLALTGIAYGGAPTGTAFIMAKFYGPKHYPTNLSVATFALIPAAIIGPYISGVLQDMSSGDFLTTFIMMGIFGIIALVSSLFLKKA